MGQGRPPANARDRLIPAALVVVCYQTPTLDLTWLPSDVPVVAVVNDQHRPHVVPDRPVQWLEPGRNVGFGAAVNMAAERVHVRRLVIVNPDTRLTTEHWHALAAGQPHEVTTIPLHLPDGQSTTVSSAYPGPIAFLLGAWRARDRLRRWLRLAPVGRGSATAGETHPLTTHWVSGAVLSIDRDRFTAVGGFDPAYFLYYEDIDLCARLAARFPQMRAHVLDVVPGTHAVGGSGGPAVAEIRRRAAGHYARKQAGRPWRIVERAVPVRPRSTSGDGADVVIVHLGRRQGFGERRRAQSWRSIASAAGLTSEELPLRTYRSRFKDIMAGIPPLIHGELVPEALSWSARQVTSELAQRDPRVVVVLTSRSYHPHLAEGGWRLVLDYVDQLSVSYSDRRRILGAWTPRGLALWLLSRAQVRFEQRPHAAAAVTAAGLADATALTAEQVPNVVSAIDRTAPSPVGLQPVDVTFVGNLAYPPNREALHELDRMVEALRALRPDVAVRIAGANPDEAIERLARTRGWDLVANFDDEAHIYAATQVAVVPIPHASGIQNKVIDACAHATPVVCYPAASAGFGSGTPLIVADGCSEMALAVDDLLGDSAALASRGREAQAWVLAALDPSRWRHVLLGVDD